MVPATNVSADHLRQIFGSSDIAPSRPLSSRRPARNRRFHHEGNASIQAGLHFRAARCHVCDGVVQVKQLEAEAAATKVATAKIAAAKAAAAKIAALKAATRAAPKMAVGRDSNGFALSGPPAATPPANYSHPSQSDCLKFRRQLRTWSNYQNAHRPAGSTSMLPSSGEVQYLYVVCGLKY